MFLPLAPLSFLAAKLIWIIVNLASTIVFVFLSCKLFLQGRVPAPSLAALTLLLIASTPWWITLGNGQYRYLRWPYSQAPWPVTSIRKPKSAAVLSCLASIKYTLVLPLFALFLPRKKDTALIVAAVLLFNALLTIVAGILVHKNPVTLVQKSLTIASSIAGTGAFDFFAFQSRVAPNEPFVPALLFALRYCFSRCCFSGDRQDSFARYPLNRFVGDHVSPDLRWSDIAIDVVPAESALSAAGQASMDGVSSSAGLAGVLRWLLHHRFCVLFETLIYENFARDTFNRIENAFSVLLYLYLFFLFARAFVERNPEMGIGSAAIADATTSGQLRAAERTSSSKSKSGV